MYILIKAGIIKASIIIISGNLMSTTTGEKKMRKEMGEKLPPP